MLASIARTFHRAAGLLMGATSNPLPPDDPTPNQDDDGRMPIAVVGAHMRGLSLNHQLQALGATLESHGRTAPRYRLYDLPGLHPPRPGLVHIGEGGHTIQTEIWRLPLHAVGAFIRGVGAPLSIGTIELASGRTVHGFLCEAHATAGALDITRYGGWRSYIAASDSGVRSPS